jgi:hypothetical protein
MVQQQEHIHPFHVNVPEAELTELRRRVNATRWPERETVTDASQGVRLAPASDHCAPDRLSRFGPQLTFSVPQPLLVVCTLHACFWTGDQNESRMVC